MKNKFDLFIIIPFVLLIIFGLMMLYSVTGAKNIDFFNKQLIWLVISVLLFFFIQYIPIKLILASSYILFFINILLLIIVKLWNMNSVERWINIGIFNIQPSEFAKLTIVLALGRFMSYREKEINSPRILFLTLSIIAIPFVFVFIQPDLGTAILFIFILIFMLILSGAKYSYILILISPILSFAFSFLHIIWIFFIVFFIIILYLVHIHIISIIKILFLNIIVGGLSPFIFSLLKEYQKLRIIAFLYPQKDIHGYGWNLLQSKIAIGSGGFLGKGFLHGTQKGLNFIPQQHTDFIFSVIGEELGFLGFMIFLALIVMIVMRIVYIFPQIRNKYSSLILGTFISLIVLQMFLNIAMTIGIIPVVGLPLNLFSYGGSNFITTVLMFAIINKISVERFYYW